MPTEPAYQRIKERGAANEDGARLRATIAGLRQAIAFKKKELGQLRADVAALVRAVNQLTMKTSSSATRTPPTAASSSSPTEHRPDPATDDGQEEDRRNPIRALERGRRHRTRRDTPVPQRLDLGKLKPPLAA